MFPFRTMMVVMIDYIFYHCISVSRHRPSLGYSVAWRFYLTKSNQIFRTVKTWRWPTFSKSLFALIFSQINKEIEKVLSSIWTQMQSIMMRRKNDDDGNLVVVTTHKQVNDRMGLTLSLWCVFACSSFLLLLFLLHFFSFSLHYFARFFTSPSKFFFICMTQVKREKLI